MFAVVQIGALQYKVGSVPYFVKVTKDDILLCDKLPYEVGQQIAFDKVLLVGTKDYTSVGRPYVKAAKVLEDSESDR